MELRVATAPGYSVPPGCFVGVRVGDVLKQGRYEPQRSYHFPTVDRRRNAKIDIYRHVGSCVLAVDPEAESTQDVDVCSNDPTFPAIKLNVNVQSASAVDNKEQRREEKTTMIKSQAKDYLAKNNIEEKLSMAVKALLKEQPENPTDFLCRYLSGGSVPSSPAAGAPPRPGEGKFADYYKATCLPNVSAAGYDAIYSKFPEALPRLRPKIPAQDASKAEGKPEGCLIASNMMMGPGFYSLNQPNMLRVI